MIKHKVMVYILIWTELDTLVCGKKTSNMEKERKLGLMVLCMKETMYMERNKELEIFSGLMVQFIMANSSTIILKVQVNIVGLMVEATMENGVTIRCTVKVFSSGQMVGNTKVTTWKIKNKDLEYFIGQMEETILDNGQMESSMVRELS